MSLTSDLSEFRPDELREAADILKALAERKRPKDFEDSELSIQLNQDSDFVFLTNSEYQTALMEDGKLVSFYSCSSCGHEGTLKGIDYESIDHTPINEDCVEFLNSIL